MVAPLLHYFLAACLWTGCTSLSVQMLERADNG